MKSILKKLFYWDFPGQGALFGTILALTGSWILLQIALLFSGIHPIFDGLIRDIPFDAGKIALWTAVLFFGYLLITGIHFGVIYRNELAFSKRWKWQIPATICWIFAAFPFLQAVHILSLLNLTMSDAKPPHIQELFTGNCGVVLSYIGFFAMFFGIFCCAKIISNAAQIPWRKLFGKGAWIVIGIFLIFSVTFTVLSCFAKIEQRNLIRQLEETYCPMTIDSLKKIDLAGRKTDEAFWQKVDMLTSDFSSRYWLERKFMKAPSVTELSREDLNKLREKLESDQELKQLEKLFSSPLPAYKHVYDMCEPLYDLHYCRYMFPLQFWRFRFAAEKQDKAAAKAALQRMENITSHLRKSPYLIFLIFFYRFENLRRESLEHYVKTFAPEKKEIMEIVSTERKKEESFSVNNFIAGDLICTLDIWDTVFGGIYSNLPIARYGWLFPAGHYLAIKNKTDFLRCYETPDFLFISQEFEEKSRFGREIFAGVYRSLEVQTSKFYCHLFSFEPEEEF